MIKKIKQGINKKVIYSLRHNKQKKEIEPICFLSSNCLGGVISHDLGMKFISPTVNLWMSPQDFVCFVAELDKYLFLDLEDCGKDEEGKPIAKLGELYIHGTHYKSFNELKEKWNERKQRVDKYRIFLLLTDQNGCNNEVVERFMVLPYPKLFFTSNERYRTYESAVYIDSDKYKKRNNGRSLVDDLCLFKGFSGKRNYEYYINIDSILKKMEKF